MNVRYVLGAIAVAALAFAGYQAAMLVSSTPGAPSAPDTTAATPAPAPAPDTPSPRVAPAGTQPYEVRAVEESLPGADAPFAVDVARRITAEQVKARMDKGQKVVFVDTRVDIPDVMIAGAVQVPEPRVGAWSRSVPKSSFVVIYCTCAAEATAAREVLALQKLGFKSAFALRDGLGAWQSLDLPTQQPPRPDGAT
jgi:rhodanese-related sulfurtransferase